MTRSRPQRPRESKGATAARANADLEKENAMLLRKIASLEKRLRRYQDQDFETDETPVQITEKIKEDKPTCPSCGSVDLTFLDIPNSKRVCFCKSCKTKVS